MLSAMSFLEELSRHGVGCISGVPCSYVSSLYSELERDNWPYVSATSEGEAVAVAAGSWLGGRMGVALCQNSGLGNMVNPLTSLIMPFRIPVVLGVSRRGWPPATDEPQHALMGLITPELLKLMQLTIQPLTLSSDDVREQLAAAFHRSDARSSTAFTIEKGVFSESPYTGLPLANNRYIHPAYTAVIDLKDGERPSRSDVLQTYLLLSGSRSTIATTGYTSRELYALDDRASHFYMVGSMGCASSIGVGLAIASRKPVTVLDGDGALLMKLGVLATAGLYVRTSFVHLVLDNGQHESTGGQASNASKVDFAAVAQACGYSRVWRAEGTAAVRSALTEALSMNSGPTLIHCPIEPGCSRKLPRPTQTLPDLAQRFREHAARLSVELTSP